MEPVYAAVSAAARLAGRALGVDLRVGGLENLPATGPVLLAANHVSYLDFVFIQWAAGRRGRRTRFLTRHDAWIPGPVGWALTRMGHVPVDRAAAAGAYLRARTLLAEEEAVGIFPEAGISHSYAVRPLMRGAAALGRESGVPVLPVAIWGSQRIYSVGDPELPPDLTRGRRVDVLFGQPLRVEAGADLVHWTEGLGHRLTEMLEALQLRPEHRPRPGELAPWYPAHLGGHAPGPDRARELDDVPSSAVRPTWGPWVPGRS